MFPAWLTATLIVGILVITVVALPVAILILLRYATEDRLHASLHNTNRILHYQPLGLSWLQANPTSSIPRPIPSHAAQSRRTGRGDTMPATPLPSIGISQTMLLVAESFGRTTGPPLLLTMQMSQPRASTMANGHSRLGDTMSYASDEWEALVDEQPIRLRDLA